VDPCLRQPVIEPELELTHQRHVTINRTRSGLPPGRLAFWASVSQGERESVPSGKGGGL
jgi:hypothetical protein